MRTIEASPFDDAGRAYYLGGNDANFLPAHDIAWIYRTTVDALLGSGGVEVHARVLDGAG